MIKPKAAVGIAAAALTVCATVGTTYAVASPATPSPTSTPTASASQTPGSHQPGKHRSAGHRQAGFNEAKALATALGTDPTKTRDALKQARTDVQAAVKANPKLTAAEREDVKATSIAKSLGVDKAKVTSALTTVADQARAERRAALKKRLDKAVTSGKITQADEDSILKAFDAKVISGTK